jgi:hypothetical protein
VSLEEMILRGELRREPTVPEEIRQLLATAAQEVHQTRDRSSATGMRSGRTP